ncbi:pentatricopeptide repeat-containing protein 2, mitochondrial-like [Watersipora subatra]|uniref:pentatricopeptide repeat-containing protein 2, mitochondrial-like n=1 Tax=Watersipora subatra TaxID=2589382 RepID=UPI00355B855A
MAFISRTRRFLIDRCFIQTSLLRHNEISRTCASLLICRSKSDRGFFAAERLKMEPFDAYCKGMQNRYGNILDEYKRRVEDQLDDPSTDVLYEDCDRYICMLNADELHKCVKVVERVISQIERDRELGLQLEFNDKSSLVALTAIRKCYLLDDVDAALDTFNLMTPQKGFVTSLKLTLDLLFKHRQYEKCAEVAVDILENNKLELSESWPYELALLAAFRMHSPEGLNYAVKIFDLVVSREDKKLSVLKMSHLQTLLGLDCVRQNHLNAALTIIDEIDADFKDSITSLNIKVLVELSAGNVDAAVRHLRKYARKTEHLVETKQRRKMERRKLEKEELESGEENQDGAEKVNQSNSRPFIYRDVFFQLKNALRDADDSTLRGYSQFVSNNYESMVSTSKLSWIVQKNILRPYKYQQRSGNLNKDEQVQDNSTRSDVPEAESLSTADEELESETASSEEERDISLHGTAV